jgi:hypothetical protein
MRGRDLNYKIAKQRKLGIGPGYATLSPVEISHFCRIGKPKSISRSEFRISSTLSAKVWPLCKGRWFRGSWPLLS